MKHILFTILVAVFCWIVDSMDEQNTQLWEDYLDDLMKD